MKSQKEKVTCPYCKGERWVKVYSLLVEHECPLCKQTGKVSQKVKTNWEKNN